MNQSTKRERVRVGVVGVGALGQHHARIYAELDCAELVGVYDADSTRAVEIASTCGTTVADSIEALLTRCDAVSVAVPTDLHHAVGLDCIRRGRHVLLEKPIASSNQEAEALVGAANEANVILQVGHVERFNPVMRFLEKTLSCPRFIEAHRLSPYPPQREGLPPRGTEVSVVLDLMIHDLDVVLHLVDSKVAEFHAVGVPVLSASADIANVRIVFENGCVANLTASRISPERMRKIRVFQQNTYLSLDYMNQEGMLYRKVDSEIVAEPVPIEKGEPLALELETFLRCVIEKRAPVVSAEHAAAALRLAVDAGRMMRGEPA